jgi:hypothetical protein
MNKINAPFPLRVLSGFAPSGFFKKPQVRASQPKIVQRKEYDAATSVQAARLNGLFTRRTSALLQSK